MTTNRNSLINSQAKREAADNAKLAALRAKAQEYDGIGPLNRPAAYIASAYVSYTYKYEFLDDAGIKSTKDGSGSVLYPLNGVCINENDTENAGNILDVEKQGEFKKAISALAGRIGILYEVERKGAYYEPQALDNAKSDARKCLQSVYDCFHVMNPDTNKLFARYNASGAARTAISFLSFKQGNMTEQFRIKVKSDEKISELALWALWAQVEKKGVPFKSEAGIPDSYVQFRKGAKVEKTEVNDSAE